MLWAIIVVIKPLPYFYSMSEPRYTNRTQNTLLASFLSNGDICGWSSNISTMVLSMMSACCAVESHPDGLSGCLHTDGLWWSWQHSCFEGCQWWSVWSQSYCAAWWDESECYADVRTALVIICTFTGPAKTGLIPHCSYHCMYHRWVSSHTCNAYATCFIMVVCMNCAACYVGQMNVRQFKKILCWISHWKTNKGMQVWAIQHSAIDDGSAREDT